MVIDKLREYLRSPYFVHGYISRNSVHEAIKAQLYVLGFKLKFIPILEASPNEGVDRRRIDCLFTKNGEPVCGIEVDYSMKKKSIEKLLQFDSSVEKIVISYGKQASCSKAVYRHKDKLQDVKHFLLHPDPF